MIGVCRFKFICLATWLALVGIYPSLGYAQTRYPTGALETPASEVAKIPKTKIYRNFHPKRIDLSRYTPRPGQQRDGSCVGWAVAYAARTQHFAWDNDVSPSKRINIASPSALYNSVKFPPKENQRECDAGSNIPTALEWLKTKGVPSQAKFPSNVSGRCSYVIPTSMLEDARRFKIKSYHHVPFDANLTNGMGISRIRDQLAQKRPVIISMDIPKSFFIPRKRHIYTDTKKPNERNGHAIILVGYDDTRGNGTGAFKIQNSWGTDWGDGGYLWMSYQSFVSLAEYAYVLETRPLKRRKDDPVPEPTLIIIEDDISYLEKARKIISQFECAGMITKASTDNQIAFFARSEEDKNNLFKRLSAEIPGVTIKGEIVPWPQCEARITFESQLERPRGLGLSLKGYEGGERPVLSDGDPFIMKIKTPDFPSYLYATYLQTDEEGKHEAIHLIQSVDPLRQYPPNTEIVIGDGSNNGDKFTISGPNFGDEMVVLIASASPLYEKERPWDELERDYLSGIRDALIKRIHGKGERLISAQILPLTTKPRE